MNHHLSLSPNTRKNRIEPQQEISKQEVEKISHPTIQAQEKISPMELVETEFLRKIPLNTDTTKDDGVDKIFHIRHILFENSMGNSVSICIFDNSLLYSKNNGPEHIYLISDVHTCRE